MKFTKNIIVTGSAGQLGQAFVNHLINCDKGYYVYSLDKKKINNNQKNLLNVEIDITKEDEVVDFFSTINNLYALINNAGIGVFTPFLSRTVKEFKDVLDVNLVGTFLMSREAIKKMVKLKYGKIINIGSIYGVNSSDHRIYGKSKRNNSEVYSISKSGIIMFSKYLSTHFAEDNIQINTISPGGIKRSQSMDFIKKYSKKNPSRRMAETNDFLPALDFLLDEKNKYINGENIIIDGGFTKW